MRITVNPNRTAAVENGKYLLVENVKVSAAGKQNGNIWDWIHCLWCGNNFSIVEWDNRHTDLDGNDMHERCCEKYGLCSEVEL